MKTIALNNPSNTVIVEAVSNGFVVTAFDESDDIIIPHVAVVEGDNMDFIEPDFDAVDKMLWQVLEYLAIYNSKDYKRVLEIRVRGNYDDGA